MIRQNVVIEKDVAFILKEGIYTIESPEHVIWSILDAEIDTGYNVVFREGCRVSSGLKIWSNSVIDARAIIGPNVRIQCNCYIAQECVVGAGVFLGPGVQLLNDRFPVRTDPAMWEPVFIGENAIIGGGVTVLPGVVIGAGAKIGAGSVVTKSVPAGEVWFGSPARKAEGVVWL